MPQDTYTKEELDAMMEKNLEKVRAMIEEKYLEARVPVEKPSFAAFRTNHYAVFNVTTAPVLPQGTEIYVDLRPSASASGIMAKYVSIGTKYVEEWAKQVNP